MFIQISSNLIKIILREGVNKNGGTVCKGNKKWGEAKERMNSRNLGEILSTITFSSLSPERVGRIFGMIE